LNRYVKHPQGKPPREIVLLKGYPCIGSCFFCDYIEDNSASTKKILYTNDKVLKEITGEFGILEVANSGSIFEMNLFDLFSIKRMCVDKEIHTLQVDAHWHYRYAIPELREMFYPIELIVSIGVETWNDKKRSSKLGKVLTNFSHPECLKYYDCVYIMVGFDSQTEEEALNDIELTAPFKYAHINIYSDRKGVTVTEEFDPNIVIDKVPDKFELNQSPDDWGIGN
jgi:uncharacterized Fe-S cluster-containing MiaB family protein